MRNQIGFKVTDNKLMVMETEENKILNQLSHQDEAIFQMAAFIHDLMLKRSNMFIDNEPFMDIEGKKIGERLNKIYIRYYEKFNY